MSKKANETAAKPTEPAAEIAVMESLTQQSAAWLVELSPRTLRDHPDVKRGADGRYDARELVRWAVQRGGVPELTDSQYETALQITEKFGDDTFCAILRPIEKLVKDIGGDKALALGAIFEVIFNDLRELVGTSPEQFELDPPDINQAFVCMDCGRLRCGRRWRDDDPPDGAKVLEATCPKCRKTYGRHREADD